MFRSRCLVLGMSLIATSCSVFKTDKKGAKATQNSVAIAGNWTSPCIAADVLSLSHTMREFNFSSIGDFDKTERFYKDENCSDLRVTYSVNGTYDAMGVDTENKNVKDINFTVNSATLTVNSDTMITVLNGLTLCGISNWAMGTATDITGKNCGGMTTSKGDVVFDVYALRDQRLYLGQKFFFMSEDDADSRPKDIEPKIAFTR